MHQNFDNVIQMNRKILIGIVMCLPALGLYAETMRVLRFVPVTGAETEVVQNTLQKVVFTPDSIVLVSASDGATTPMYKYDYRAIVFDESGSSEAVGPTTEQQPQTVKFIRNGQLFIRLDEQVYDVLGHKLQIEN